jgi:hypothetical protein
MDGLACEFSNGLEAVMLAPWAVEEMKSVDLGDVRLDHRAVGLLSALSAGPTLSIPAACGGHAETQAAYRFFDNDRVGFDGVLQPHVLQTTKRIAALGKSSSRRPVVILAQDTTEIDLTRPRQVVAGAGTLGYSRHGVLLHLIHAFTPDGTPLGSMHAQCITRTEKKKKDRKTRPIEDKESMRWLDGLCACERLARQTPSVQCVCVADSEADLYQWVAESCVKPSPADCGRIGPRSLQADWVIRASADRRLLPDPQNGDEEPCGKLREHLTGAAVLYQAELDIRERVAKFSCEKRKRRKNRRQRRAQVSVRAASVILDPPNTLRSTTPSVRVNVVLVHEDCPPQGEDPVDWLLLTTLPIDSLDQVRAVVEYYCVRWNIEILFRTLKSGCRIEQRRVEDLDRILPCMAMYLIVAWRTLFVCRMGDACPEADCQVVFETSEWQAVWTAVHGKKPPNKKKRPRLGEIVDLIAGLGGYIKRPGSRPGPQTMWIGLQRAYDLSWAWMSFGPGQLATKT